MCGNSELPVYSFPKFRFSAEKADFNIKKRLLIFHVGKEKQKPTWSLMFPCSSKDADMAYFQEAGHSLGSVLLQTVRHALGPWSKTAFYLCKLEYLANVFPLFLSWPPLSIWSSQARDQIRAAVATPDPLTHCAGLGIEPASWCCRDATNPGAPQQELLNLLLDAKQQACCEAFYKCPVMVLAPRSLQG